MREHPCACGQQPAVLVTGVSTGIGKATALALVQAGFTVFGTVRKPADGKYLKSAGGYPLLLDVTRPSSLEHAFRRMKTLLRAKPLYGLVNNAGISICAPWEHVDMKDVRLQMEINLFGVIMVTQRFLPLLKQAHGRIIMISSTSGRSATALMGPYCCSKFALEALVDTLRQEVKRAGVEVVSIQPGPTKTPIFAKTRNWVKKKYAAQVAAGIFGSMEALSHKMADNGIPPERIAKAVVQALTARRPALRRIISRHPWWHYLESWLPLRLRDWIICQAVFGFPSPPARTSRPTASRRHRPGRGR
ncbi:SDR family oxidoreductase [candidate division FCPU426 bacterium]|nr:SDR family oxidoreductase [candidate division FCPU426 bacterium]